MQRSSDALLTVINDVLDYSKIEAGRMTVEQIDMDLQSVCDGVRAILQSAALERGVSMRIDYDARLPKYIKGDPARIRQVLLNLAGNAVKFTEAGSVHIAATRLDAARLKISVTDTGIGIIERTAGHAVSALYAGGLDRRRGVMAAPVLASPSAKRWSSSWAAKSAR